MLMSASGCGVDSSLKTSGIGRDLALVTWVGTGGPGPVERAAEEAYASIDAALRERGCVPVQERAFGDLQAAPGLARGRARAVGTVRGVGRADHLRGGLAGRPRRPLGHPRGRGARELPPPGRGRPGVRTGRGGRHGAPRRARGRGPAGVGAAGGRPGRRRGGRPRRGGGAAGPRGLLLPRRGADVVLPPRHPRLVRPLQRSPQRRVPPDGTRGPGRRRPDPGQHRDRGAQRAGRVVRARPPRAAAPGRGRDAAAPQPPAERGDRVRLGVRPRHGSRPRRRALPLRLRHGLDRRPRRDRARGRLRDAGALHARGGGGAPRRAPARASRTWARRPPSSRTPATGALSSASSTRSGLREAPLVTTVADVCRNDLLFEIDAVAVVPLARGARR